MRERTIFRLKLERVWRGRSGYRKDGDLLGICGVSRTSPIASRGNVESVCSSKLRRKRTDL